MNIPNTILLAFLLAGAGLLPARNAQAGAFEDLAGLSGAAVELPPEPKAAPEAAAPQEARQQLPEKNSEPGFDWAREKASGGNEHYFFTADLNASLRITGARPENLPDGTGKCALARNTRYLLSGTPGFEGDNIKVTLKEPLPGCKFKQGYVYMGETEATSLGGESELPPAVRAFLDTIAYAEGTTAHYNYMFAFDTFISYGDHPRVKRCDGRLCSTAAGRYQFLSDTWDALAADLGLTDFTPPSQDKAVMELIRRAGAYKAVAGSASHKNFTRAVHKLNGIWASLPGNRYGQPKRSPASLWKYYNAALGKYKF